MANGRDYGSFDYGIGVYGQALIVDAEVTIAAASNSTAAAIQRSAAAATAAVQSNTTSDGTRIRQVDMTSAATSNASSIADVLVSGVCNIEAQSGAEASPVRRLFGIASSIVVSGMTSNGRYLWEPDAVPAETWAAETVSDEMWTPVGVSGGSWAVLDVASDTWTPASVSPQTWQ